MNHCKATMRLFTVLLFLIAQSCIAQECTPSPTQTGVSYQSGALVLPQSNDFHQNTFDWTQAEFPVFKQDFGDFDPTETLRSPYWRSNPFYAFMAKEQYSDFLPEAGWELVKQDMGYLYSSTSHQWNGTGITNSSIYDNINTQTGPRLFNEDQKAFAFVMRVFN